MDSDLCSSRVNLESLLIRISCKVLSRWHGRGPRPQPPRAGRGLLAHGTQWLLERGCIPSGVPGG